MTYASTDESVAGPSGAEALAATWLTRDARQAPVVGYLVAVALVGAAIIVAFVVDNLVPATNLSLVFVLPVIIAASGFGWGPAFTAALTGVLSFDFFFTEPRFTFVVTNPADLWTMALLLVIAAIVSTVAAQSRDRALAASRAADQAQALRELANVVIHAASPVEVTAAAAKALARVFGAPAIVVAQDAGKLALSAEAGGAAPSTADMDAARTCLSTGLPTRADTYPTDGARFDFWPVTGVEGPVAALGIGFADAGKRRARDAERVVEVVRSYLIPSRVRP